MIEDPEAIKNALLRWSEASTLKDATIASDGTTLNFESDSLSAPIKITITIDERSCEYSAASIFLQIRNPEQGLVAYRSECKVFSIADPIKARDKATIVGFFRKDVAAAAAADAAAPAPEPPVQQEEALMDVAPEPDRSKHRKEKKRKDEKRRERKTSSDKHITEEPAPKKKRPDLVTTEQLFDNLNVVVGKRRQDAATEREAEAITKALSTKGFEITSSEQLEPYKEKTAAILANEIPVGNSASILRANNPRKDLSRVLELYMESIGASSKEKTSKTTASAAKTPSKPVKSYLIGKKPVIIMPKGMTAPLTLINAHEFLSQAKFVPRDVMLKNNKNSRPQTTFTRTIKTGLSTGLLEYEIIDDPRKLGSDPKEWERIVAVICLGLGWQFKDWLREPAYNQAATLFDKVYGFFVAMEGDKLPKEVEGWAVTKASLNRDKRGLDSVTYATFWNGLDEWMRVYKAELLPRAES